ncbi:bacteriohemerythrin [Clostridium acetireducens DSM 10703]|jgi:hemerythrin|uniref:Bacteriohemerythrin n=1 Tax=Clostridium acetireducens DSM 10703 TaxID=1121290 RepID=A0A1E8F0M4_9CLOT|nr:bacteriohemerythrin [Clostridium acetireducens]OFI06987.1 bacteriohemerythrin [Clostridium acetireducens DSM 10703]
MFIWKESYNVDIEQIDNQHRRLFQLGNNIYDIVKLNDNYDHYDEIMTALDALKEYTVYHFGTEEKLMKEYNFKKYEDHKIEHDAFIKRISGFSKKDIDNEQKEVLLDLLSFILNWIEAHILGSDMKYREFFHNKGVY